MYMYRSEKSFLFLCGFDLYCNNVSQITQELPNTTLFGLLVTQDRRLLKTLSEKDKMLVT